MFTESPKRNAAPLLLFLLLCSCGASGQQQQPKSAAPKPPQERKSSADRAPIDDNKFAIVIAGVGGEDLYRKKFTEQATLLYSTLTEKLGFAEQNTILLTEGGAGDADEGAPSEPARRSTAEEVKKAFESLKSRSKQDSLVFVFLIGHGSFDNQIAKFNLVGPDLSAKDYAGLLSALPSKRVVFVDCSSSSGEFIKPLSGEGRIILTATRSGNEQNVTVFADHFIAALTDPAADADKNGRISVLEAFTFASKQTADWYKQKDRLATEHALIDDNGDGTGHEDATAGDGVLAKTTYIDSKPIGQASGDAELAALLKKRQELEEAVEKLKARKAEMKAEEYDSELERLLVELAKTSQAIKSRQK
ncbi:MAG: hypothetical protein DMF61_21805 [Blastocatellia bacterium AA13]|nr:MAG: hypothetical protein DMF61_21805 [Blastocatellia bacterium AA13]